MELVTTMTCDGYHVYLNCHHSVYTITSSNTGRSGQYEEPLISANLQTEAQFVYDQ